MSTATTHIKTDKQLVPALRFNEFENKWIKTSFGEMALFVNGKAYKQAELLLEGKYKVLRVGNLFSKSDWYYSDLELDENKYVEDGDLMYAWSASFGPHFWKGPKTIYHYHIWKVLPAEQTDKQFLFQSFLNDLERIKSQSQGGTMFHITKGNIEQRKIGFPTLAEQQKIASFLSAVDEKIQQLSKKKALLEDYKKGVMQQLFSGQLRFKDENGKDYPDWKPRKMSEVLFEHKLNSTGNEEVYSVSVHKGLVNQVEHLGRVFAAKNTDNYNLVQPDDIVYTKSPTGSFPLGIIKLSKMDKNVIVSPLYGIFTPETPGLGYLFNVFFESPINVKNYLASIIQKGAKNTINITNTTFLSKKIKLPVSKEEQNRIGDFLKEIDTKIGALKNQTTQTQTFKKGLLQQMFV